MNNLLDLQLSFSNSIIYDQDATNSWLSKAEMPGLAIYNHAYSARMQDTLAQDFPALMRLLGEASFYEMAVEYLQEQPSASFSLRDFGQHLPIFLSKHPNYLQQTYLAELAYFECQLNDIFDVADTPVVGVAEMNQIPPESWPSLKVKLHESIRWLTLQWNIGDIYPALKANPGGSDLIKNQQQQQYLIWRQHNSPHYRRLDAQEWLALKTLEQHDFGQLCLILNEVSESPENAPLTAATYLKAWVGAGLIEAVNCVE